MSSALAREVILFTSDVHPDSKALAFQLARSGCSIGTSITEAQGAESKNDFVHKLKIADKEARETLYWLDLLRNVDRGGDQEKLREICRNYKGCLTVSSALARKEEIDKGSNNKLQIG